MITRHKVLPCRTCRQKFNCVKTADGLWATAFARKPPSEECRWHPGSALCRWETHEARVRWWRKVGPAFDPEQPHAFVTVVPPTRLIPFDRLDKVDLENEKRAVRRVLRAMLPRATRAVAVFDLQLIEDATVNPPERCWAPHFHILVVGMTATEVRALGAWPYKETALVPQPIHRVDAKTPKGALFYSAKHIDDVRARAVFRKEGGSGKRGHRPRRLAADERRMMERFVLKNPIGTYFYLKEFKSGLGAAEGNGGSGVV